MLPYLLLAYVAGIVAADLVLARWSALAFEAAPGSAPEALPAVHAVVYEAAPSTQWLAWAHWTDPTQWVPGWASWTDAAALLAIVCAALGATFCRRRPGVAFACASLVAFLAGVLALGVQLEGATRGAASFAAEGVTAVVQGRVAEVTPFETADQIVLDEVVAIDGAELPRRILIYRDRFDPALHQIEFPEWLPGDRVRASLKLKRPAPSRNPGALDRARMLARRGIGAEGRLVDPALQVQIETREGLGPLRAVWCLRAKWMALLRRSDAGAGLVRALVFGDRSGLSDAVRAAFARFGLAHLLAVSGLHLICVAAPCYRIFCFLLLRMVPLAHRRDSRKWALALTIGVAMFYGFLSGWAVPVQRAMLFLSVIGIGFYRERPTGKSTLLSFAALIVLLLDPAALFAPGAQLSFAATAALLFAAPRPTEGAENAEHASGTECVWWQRVWVDSLRTTATVLLLTAPLTAWYFGTLGAWGLLANVVAVPWTAFVLLPSSLIGVIALGFPGGERLLSLCLGIAHATEIALLQCDAWLAHWVLGAGAAPALWACVAAFGVGLLGLRVKRTRMRLLAGVALGLFLSWAPRHSLLSNEAHAIFFDVGQGDAVLVQGAQASDGKRRNILIDAGTAIPGGFDAGQSVVVPALRALGVRELDLLIVTHEDLDHRGGVPSVLDAVRVKEIWLPHRVQQNLVSDADSATESVPGAQAALPAAERAAAASREDGARREARDAGFAALLAHAAKRKIVVRERGLGDPALILDELRVVPLWPPSGNAAFFHEHESENDTSLVVRIAGPDFSLLLPGDLERAGERALLETGVTRKVDILKLGHHGSRSSSTSEWLARADATLGIVSAPCAGRFGMPHREVVERSRVQALSLWWTGRDGAVVVGLEKPIWVRGWLEQPLRCP